MISFFTSVAPEAIQHFKQKHLRKRKANPILQTLTTF